MSDESSQVINFIRISYVRMLQHTFSEVTVKCFFNLHIRWVTGVNPLSANSDHQQFSPNNIHTLSRDKVMRINKMITIEKML